LICDIYSIEKRGIRMVFVKYEVHQALSEQDEMRLNQILSSNCSVTCNSCFLYDCYSISKDGKLVGGLDAEGTIHNGGVHTYELYLNDMPANTRRMVAKISWHTTNARHNKPDGVKKFLAFSKRITALEKQQSQVMQRSA